MTPSTSSTTQTRAHRPTQDEIVKSAVHQLVFGATATKIAAVAAELGLPDLLVRGPRSVADLAGRCDLHPGSLRRLLRALAGLGLVDQVSPDLFRLTSLGEALGAHGPESVRPVITMLWGEENWSSWGAIRSSLATGEPGWLAAHGQSWVEYYASHPDSSAVFNEAMSQHTRQAAPGLIAACDLSRFGTVVDVGGGDGTLVAEMLVACPDLSGVVFDLPSGLAAATEMLRAAGVSKRSRVVTGDFFEEVPRGGDAYVLKQVLHDWPDARAANILSCCRAAMDPGSRLLVLERVLPEVADAASAQALLLDMHMLVVTGGQERTRQEFAALLAGAGFELDRVSERLEPFGYHVIEATPVR